MSATAPQEPKLGSCFIDATQTQFHKQIPSVWKAPLLGYSDWRVGLAVADKMMERRGWVQPLCTTVTTPEQIQQLKSDCERIFIPGEFSRQGDVLAAAAASGKLIFLERGAFLAPTDLVRAVEKLGEAKSRVILVEAGSSFGYSDRVLDPRALEVSLSMGCPIALNLHALSTSAGARYEHRPDWLDQSTFDIAYIRTALAFNVQYLILPKDRDLNPAAADLWLSARKDAK